MRGGSPYGCSVSMALYRTYRPARLDEVVGQEHVTGPLRRALETDRVHHAYLFSGPRGCGKTSTARILARSLNCAEGPTPDPCGQCQSCLDLAPNGAGSIDVIELDAASHGRVEDTRDLRERAMFAPAASRYKIYIIDEAHMVSNAGFNALLKLVEEPPEHVRFIFATTEADKVLPTIRSRTHNYTFRLVSSRTLQSHLAAVCDAEEVPAEPAALALIARAGAGSVRDSLSILGQVIAGCGPDGVTYQQAVDQLGLTDVALLDATVSALAAGDGAQLFTLVDQVMEAGHDPRRFVTDLLERLRNLIVLQHVPGAAAMGLIDAPEDQIATQVEQAASFGGAELARAADVVSAGLSDLKGATAPRLMMELMAGKLLLPATDLDAGGLRTRMDQLERKFAAGSVVHSGAAAPGVPPAAHSAPPKLSSVAPSTAQSASDTVAADQPTHPAPAKAQESQPVDSGVSVSPTIAATPSAAAVDPSSSNPSRPPAKPGTKAAASVQAGQPAQPASGAATVPLAQVQSMWPAVLEATKSYSKVAWMVFADSVPLSTDNAVLAVAVADASKINNIKSSGHDERLRQSVLDVLGVDVRVDVVLAPDAVAARPTAVDVQAGAPMAASAAERSIEPDAPSPDDADIDDATGVELILRELGGTQIGEIEH